MELFKKLNQKNIFLLDGVGALMSALSTGGLLPLFSDLLGIPKDTLYVLGLVAAVFAVYSFVCYGFVKQVHSKMLLGIVLANSLYCFVLGALVLTSPVLTILGKAVFIIETFVIAAVVFLEIQVYRRSF